ncbi:MAG: hypothetical protein Q8Q02_11045 [Nocardioides sp.]|nr:hypothetical protein [Nocardioides sp.]
MGNVNVPTPVFVAGGALCLLGGYLIGVVAGPDTPQRTTAEVLSYDAGASELCLTGETVEGAEGAEDGTLCGTWRRTPSSQTPRAGDPFRFVSMEVDNVSDDSGERLGPGTVIYGSVLD